MVTLGLCEYFVIRPLQKVLQPQALKKAPPATFKRMKIQWDSLPGLLYFLFATFINSHFYISPSDFLDKYFNFAKIPQPEIGMTSLYLLSSTLAASSGSCSFKHSVGMWMTHISLCFPLPWAAVDTQMNPTTTSVSRKGISSRTPFAHGLFHVTSSGIRVQSQAWKESSKENCVALPFEQSSITLLLQFSCCQNWVPRCSSSTLKKCMHLSGFGRTLI